MFFPFYFHNRFCGFCWWPTALSNPLSPFGDRFPSLYRRLSSSAVGWALRWLPTCRRASKRIINFLQLPDSCRRRISYVHCFKKKTEPLTQERQARGKNRRGKYWEAMALLAGCRSPGCQNFKTESQFRQMHFRYASATETILGLSVTGWFPFLFWCASWWAFFVCVLPKLVLSDTWRWMGGGRKWKEKYVYKSFKPFRTIRTPRDWVKNHPGFSLSRVGKKEKHHWLLQLPSVLCTCLPPGALFGRGTATLLVRNATMFAASVVLDSEGRQKIGHGIEFSTCRSLVHWKVFKGWSRREHKTTSERKQQCIKEERFVRAKLFRGLFNFST